MEALGAAGSIAGLVSLGDAVFRGLYRYVKAVKKAEKDVLSLKNEVTLLAGILHNLKSVAEVLEADDEFDNSIRVDHVNSCFDTLYSLNDKLKEIEFPKNQRTRTVFRKLAWPYKSGETKDLAEEICKHREILSLALSADNATALIRCLSSQEAMASQINDLEQSSQKREELETRKAIDEARQRILHYFAIVDPHHNYKTVVSLRYPDTGLWLIEGETFRTWLRQRGSTIWLSGIPGAGKTVLSGLIIQKCLARAASDCAVAYFFCEYNNPQSQSTVNILGSLAAQLAVQHEDCFALLKKYYDFLQPTRALESARPEVKDLLKLLQDMAQCFDDVRLIVDGLDECGDNAEEASESLKMLATEHYDTISLALLSRDETPIRAHLGPPTCTHIEIAAQTKDIEYFVRAEVELRSKKTLRIKSPGLKDMIIEILVSKAQGMFRWVTCQLDYLCGLSTDLQRRKALHELPITLASTYERILKRIKPQDVPMARKTLQWVSYASPRLRTEELLEVVSIEVDDNEIDPEARPDEEDILRCCSSLIRKREDFWELAHFTVQEYLDKIGDSNLKEFCSGPRPRLLLARTCLTYLCFTDFNKPPPIERDHIEAHHTDYPFLLHAASSWTQYSLNCMDDVELFSQLQRLFHPRRTYNFLSYITSLFIAIHDEYLNRKWIAEQPILWVTAKEFGPLHGAALLGLNRLCQWLVAEGCDINQESPIGSPIECSIFGPKLSFARRLKALGIPLPTHDRYEDQLHIARPETVITLLHAGANCKPNTSYTPSLAYAALHLTRLQPTLFSILVKHGLPIEMDAMKLLEKRSVKPSRYKEVVSSLLQVVQESESLNISDEDRAEIIRLGMAYGAEVDSLIPVGDKSSDPGFLKLVKSAIKFDQLETFQVLIENVNFSVDLKWQGLGDTTLLHVAASSHATRIMEALLDFGFDPSQTDGMGQTVLYKCTTLHHDSLVQRLIASSKAVSIDTSGQTVWHKAASKGGYRTIELLIEYFGEGSSGPLVVSEAGKTALLEAVTAGHESCALLLLNILHLNHDVLHDWRLIHYSTALGLQDILDQLIEKGVDVATTSDTDKSALHFLTAHTSLNMLEILTKHGLTPEDKDSNGKSAIHTFLDGTRHADLAKAGVHSFNMDYLDVEQIDRLVTAAVVRLEDQEGRVPWEVFCKDYVPRMLNATAGPDDPYMLVDIGEVLVREGATTAYDQEQQEPCAVDLLVHNFLDSISPDTLPTRASALSGMIQRMLKNPSVSSAPKNDPQLIRLLTMSIKVCDELLFQCLLDHGVDLKSPSTYYSGYSGIEQLGFSNGSHEMFQKSLEHVEIAYLSQLGRSGMSLLHILCDQTPKDDWDEASTRMDVLLNLGIDPDVQASSSGKTALHFAIESAFMEGFRTLSQHKANVDLLSKNRWGVVAHAIKSGDKHMLQELLKTLQASALWKHKFDLQMPWNRSEVITNCTAFHLAALQGLHVLEFLASTGYYQNFHEASDLGFTPLHLSVTKPNVTVTKWLIDHGADVNAAANDGQTALHFTVIEGDLSMVHILLQAGANFTFDKWGRSPETLAPSSIKSDFLALLGSHAVPASVLANYHRNNVPPKFFFAIQENDLYICRQLLQSDSTLISVLSPTCGSCTPLAIALFVESWDIVDLLLKCGASPAGFVCKTHSPVDFPEISVLCLAVAKPAFNSRLQTFLEICANNPDQWVRNGLNPLHIAAYYNPDSIDILLSHINKNEEALRRALDLVSEDEMIGRVSPQTELLNCPAFNNWSTQAVRLTGSATPLHVAVLCKQPETVAKLISSGAEIHLQNNLGETPLHFAALSDCKDSARILLNHGAIATFRDHLLMTPLMTACAHGSIAVEKILTVHERGEPCVDVDKMSALHHSACKSSLEVFIRLVEAGWDPQAKDAWGHSSIELAFQRKQFCPYMLMSGLDLKCLLPRGSDFTYPTIFFDWPLLLRHLLRRFPQESLPRLVNYQSSNREHPICYAARSADLISMEALIVAGVDIEHSEYAGRTALICACLVGQLESVKFLVRKGAKTQYWYKERHMNVLDAASNHPEIVDWFLLRRHMEQSARLVNSGEMEDTGKRLKNWSGVWVLNVPLEGFYSRKPGQSRLDWVKTIHSRKKDWRRMVPPNWDPVAHLSLLAAQ